jgi:D-glycero-D-manno-heptose 1,7-bisphosphate phosphatase
MTKLCANFTLVTPRPAIFLDRDGILIEDLEYVNSSDRTNIYPDAIESIKIARSKGFLIFVVTNQAGIARNLYTETQCVNFNEWLMSEFSGRGAPIDQLVYCPSHPDFSTEIKCLCRKPGTGMLSYLAEKWHINLSESLLIGDRESDFLAGHNFGISSEIVNSESKLIDIVKNHVNSSKYGSNVEVMKANE